MNVHRWRVIMGWAFWSSKITGMFGSLPCQCVFISRLDLWMDICQEEFFFLWCPLMLEEYTIRCLVFLLSGAYSLTVTFQYTMLSCERNCLHLVSSVGFEHDSPSWCWKPEPRILSSLLHTNPSKHSSADFFTLTAAFLWERCYSEMGVFTLGTPRFTYKLSGWGRTWSDVM